jgi:hypothetical protein
MRARRDDCPPQRFGLMSLSLGEDVLQLAQHAITASDTKAVALVLFVLPAARNTAEAIEIYFPVELWRECLWGR